MVAVVFVLMWGFAVTAISITGGHGRETGSIFLAVWINVILSLDLATMNFVIIWSKYKDGKSEGRDVTQDQGDSHENRDEDVPRSNQNGAIGELNEDAESAGAITPSGRSEESLDNKSQRDITNGHTDDTIENF